MPLIYGGFFLSPRLWDTNTNIHGEEKLINVTIDCLCGTQDLESNMFAKKDEVEFCFLKILQKQNNQIRAERLKFLTLFLSISDSP